MNDLILRRDAAQATFDRFNGRPIVWGRDDCIRMAAFVARKRGHSVSLAKAGSYSSPRSALRALSRTGFATLEEAIDAEGFLQIPPAAALPADLIAGEAEEAGPWLALGVCLGNGRILGFQGGICRPLQPRFAPGLRVMAWRL